MTFQLGEGTPEGGGSTLRQAQGERIGLAQGEGGAPPQSHPPLDSRLRGNDGRVRGGRGLRGGGSTLRQAQGERMGLARVSGENCPTATHLWIPACAGMTVGFEGEGVRGVGLELEGDGFYVFDVGVGGEAPDADVAAAEVAVGVPVGGNGGAFIVNFLAVA